MKEFLDGGEVMARAAIHAGCDFFAGYPITPSTPILTHLLRELPKVGGVGIQAEDEMAAMGFCIGAALAGRRVMTATSGPGISLFSENIGLAIMGEVPMVIVDAQRMGPATGGATTVAQGDVQFLRWGTSGGFPVIVLAPVDLHDAYTLTLKAFDLAERFRIPVFVATDKDTISGKATVEAGSWERVPVRERALASPEEAFFPYRVAQPDEVPAMAHFGGPHRVRFTTSSHDEGGYQAKFPRQFRALNQHLMEKVEKHVDEVSLVRWDRREGARTLVVSYGVTAMAVREAVKRSRVNELGPAHWQVPTGEEPAAVGNATGAGGSAPAYGPDRVPGRGETHSVTSGGDSGLKGDFPSGLSSLEVLSLWPVPERELAEAMEGVDRVVVAEMNFGQYRREVERVAGLAFRGRKGPEIVGVARMDGELISPEEILAAVKGGGS